MVRFFLLFLNVLCLHLKPIEELRREFELQLFRFNLTCYLYLTQLCGFYPCSR